MSDTTHRIGRPETDLLEFVAAIEARLEIGAVEYQDRPAAARPLAELVDEIGQELVDVAGWSFLLWRRVEGLRATLGAVQSGWSIETRAADVDATARTARTAT